MKKNKNNILIAIFSIIIILLLCRYCKELITPRGMVLVEQATVDSLRAYVKIADSLEILANLPPDTVFTDTVFYGIPVFAETVPIAQPDPIDSTLITYSDSMVVKDSISAWIEFTVKGHLEGTVKWEYKPIIKEVKTTIYQPVPYPVIENVEIPTPITGHYLSLGVDGNEKMFIFGVDYDMVKKNNIYGLQYRRFGNDNIYGVKFGINLFTLFKKKR